MTDSNGGVFHRERCWTRHAVGLICAAAAASSPAEVGFDAAYTADYIRNHHGGIRQGSAYLQNVDLLVWSEFATRLADDPARAFAYVLYDDASTVSDRLVGDVQGVSNIDAREALRVYELWYQQPFGDGWSARFGLYDLNSEFDVMDVASLFLNSSHGIGYDFSQSGVAGPSIFPVTSLALRVEWAHAWGTLRYAILDAVPGDPDHPSRTTIDVGGDQGVLHVMESDLKWPSGLRAAAGYWRYSARFDYLNRFDALGNRERGRGNDGFYVLVESAPIAGIAGRTVQWFARYGRADDAFNAFGDYLGAGVVVRNPFNEADAALGIAMASTGPGHAFRQSATSRPSRETAIEITYEIQLTQWLRLQPDFQYVINPGTDPGLGNATVLGLRLVLAKPG